MSWLRQYLTEIFVFIKAMLLLCKHGSFSLNFASHAPPPTPILLWLNWWYRIYTLHWIYQYMFLPSSYSCQNVCILFWNFLQCWVFTLYMCCALSHSVTHSPTFFFCLIYAKIIVIEYSLLKCFFSQFDYVWFDLSQSLTQSPSLIT